MVKLVGKYSSPMDPSWWKIQVETKRKHAQHTDVHDSWEPKVPPQSYHPQ